MTEKTKALLRSIGFKMQIDAVDAGKCPLCKEAVKREDFTSERAAQKFDQSGLCEHCEGIQREPMPRD